ncbi:MAG: hypothetical protein IT577_05300 [Verrucomicrobiae bacterium]|nr:hypothetical protein [Verrucomicrobiae bacterium]
MRAQTILIPCLLAATEAPADLAGEWAAGPARIEIEQNDAQIIARYTEVPANPYGIVAGDPCFQGTVSGNTINADLVIRAEASKAPGMSTTMPVVLNIDDHDSRIEGTYRQTLRFDAKKRTWISAETDPVSGKAPDLKRLILQRTLTPSEIRFLILSPSGTRVVNELSYNVPIIAELLFDDTPGGNEYTVEIDTGFDRHPIAATRTGEDGKTYRTQPFLLQADDGMGLRTPPPKRSDRP